MTLVLEGQIVAEWVDLLEDECVKALGEKPNVVLDCAAVLFIDGRAVAMLKRIATEHLQIVKASPLVEELLLAGGDP